MDMSGWGCGGGALCHCLLGGSGCDVAAILSANKTDKTNPVSCLHEQGVVMCSSIV